MAPPLSITVTGAASQIAQDLGLRLRKSQRTRRGICRLRPTASGNSLRPVKCLADRAREALLATLIVLCAGCLLAPGVALAGTLDQQQTDGSGGNSAIFSGQSDAQTFTAGLSGGVDQVDLQLGALTPTAPLTVEIRNVSGGAPGAMVLASQSVPGSSVPGSPAFVSIHFATPAPVVAGTQYAIVAYSSTNSSNSYGWAYSPNGANPYTGGGGLYTLTSPPSGAWSPLNSTDTDLAFKTYVVVPTSGPAGPYSGPAGPTSGPTGQRAAALKKCKKKFPGKANAKKRKKCIKKAKRLPV